MTRTYAIRTIVLVLTLAGWTGMAAAQNASSLDVSEATDYLGEWVLIMEIPRGTSEQTLSISDVGGKVAATVAGGRGGEIEITDISRSDAGLVLKFERNIRSTMAPVVMTISLDGDTLNAVQDINDGASSTSGSGKKR